MAKKQKTNEDSLIDFLKEHDDKAVNEAATLAEGLLAELNDLRDFKDAATKGYKYHESEATKAKEELQRFKLRVTALRTRLADITDTIRKVKEPWADRVHELVARSLKEDK